MAQDNSKVQVILLWVIWIVGLIWILAEGSYKKDKFVSFWLKQWLAMVVIGVIVWVLGFILTIVTLGLFGIVLMLLWIGFLVLWIIGLISIIKGDMKPVPVIGKYGVSWFKF